MRPLLLRLKKFNLTKPEVLVMINLGVGVKKAGEPGQTADETQNRDETDTVGNEEGDLLDKVERHINSAEGPGQTGGEDVQMEDGQEDNPDITVLNTVIEDMYDRFNDAEINEMLQICGEVLGATDIDQHETPLQQE
jgi:hypothetical protein